MTTQIAELTEALEQARTFNEQDQRRLADEPARKSSLFFARTSATRISCLEQALRLEMKKRDREILKVKLHGGPVTHGSAPLSVFAHFLASFADAIESATYRVFAGVGGSKRIPREVQQQIDLRIVGFEAGSVGINLSGRLSPDLGGSTPLETTLHHLFDLVCASDDGIYESLDAIGYKAIRSLSKAFKALQDYDTSVDFAWVTPLGIQRSWSADVSGLAEIRSRLGIIEEPVISTQTVMGEVVELSSNGRISLIDESSEKIRIRFGQSQIQAVAKLNLWTNATFDVRTERSFNRARNQHIERHWLLDVNPSKHA
jgi:hypothetical protein